LVLASFTYHSLYLYCNLKIALWCLATGRQRVSNLILVTEILTVESNTKRETKYKQFYYALKTFIILYFGIDNMMAVLSTATWCMKKNKLCQKLTANVILNFFQQRYLQLLLWKHILYSDTILVFSTCILLETKLIHFYKLKNHRACRTCQTFRVKVSTICDRKISCYVYMWQMFKNEYCQCSNRLQLTIIEVRTRS